MAEINRSSPSTKTEEICPSWWKKIRVYSFLHLAGSFLKRSFCHNPPNIVFRYQISKQNCKEHYLDLGSFADFLDLVIRLRFMAKENSCEGPLQGIPPLEGS